MNIQEQGFRSSLFGFDKNDVLAYMNALANEAQQQDVYKRQVLRGAAQEPEIGDMISFLCACGADISGYGTSILTVQGGRPLGLSLIHIWSGSACPQRPRCPPGAR